MFDNGCIVKIQLVPCLMTKWYWLPTLIWCWAISSGLNTNDMLQINVDFDMLLVLFNAQVDFGQLFVFYDNPWLAMCKFWTCSWISVSLIVISPIIG
jgi:hypothetical protein